MTQQTRHAGTAHAVWVLLTLFGLLGMHGLPNAMATSSPVTATKTGMAVGMQTGSHDPEALPAVASAWDGGASPESTHDVGSAHLTDRSAARESPQRPSAARSAVIPMSCRMDHAGCLAVLRAATQLPGPVEALPAAAIDPLPASPAATPSRAPRTPPDVSLIGLGISRT